MNMIGFRNYPVKPVLLCAATLVATFIMIGDASSNGNPPSIPANLGAPVISAQGENDYVPFKVTGSGVYEHYYVGDPNSGVEWFASDEEVGLFSISMDPNGTSPQAVIRVDGCSFKRIGWPACPRMRTGRKMSNRVNPSSSTRITRSLGMCK
jgi:hypothetical protein